MEFPFRGKLHIFLLIETTDDYVVFDKYFINNLGLNICSFYDYLLYSIVDNFLCTVFDPKYW